MANGNQVVGQVRVKIDGDLLDTDGASTMQLGGPVRTAVGGDYQAGSFSVKTVEAKCEVSLLLKAGLDLLTLRNVDNATLTMETDVGTAYVMRGAYLADVISFSTGDGKAKVVFQGPPAEGM